MFNRKFVAIFASTAVMAAILTGVYSGKGAALEKPRDQGIGGTGIIGAITGFGSIFVNGYEVDYTPDQIVANDAPSGDPSQLKIGQIVTVIARGSGRHLQAVRISVQHEVVGPVSHYNWRRRLVVILGQKIDISAVKNPGSIKQGQWLAISGLRDGRGTVRARLIETVQPGNFQLIGTERQIGSIVGDAGRKQLGVHKAEQRLIVRGHGTESNLTVDQTTNWTYFSNAGHLSHVSIEGYYGLKAGDAIKLNRQTGWGADLDGSPLRVVHQILNILSTPFKRSERERERMGIIEGSLGANGVINVRRVSYPDSGRHHDGGRVHGGRTGNGYYLLPEQGGDDSGNSSVSAPRSSGSDNSRGSAHPGVGNGGGGASNGNGQGHD